MARLTAQEQKNFENRIKQEYNKFENNPNIAEGIRAQKQMLDLMLMLISENSSVNGSPQFGYMETILKQTKEQCEELLDPKANTDAAKLEHYCAMLAHSARVAENYLDYKKNDVHATGSDLEKNRISTAEFIRDMANKSASVLGDRIYSARADKMFPKSDKTFDEQIRFMLDLKKELTETMSVLHPHGKDFDNLIKQLDATIGDARIAKSRCVDVSVIKLYGASLKKLEFFTDRYLEHKKNSNDFGYTSTTRIKKAGQLKLMLSKAEPFISQNAEEIKNNNVREARAWFSGLAPVLKEKENIDISNPIMATGLVILNPREDMDRDVIAEYMDSDISPEEHVEHIAEIAKTIQIALAPVDVNGDPKHPLKENEDVAKWIFREIPASPDKDSSFSDEHVLHLYRMAKENRLIYRSNKDVTAESERFIRITVKPDNTCDVDKAFEDIGANGVYKDVQLYDTYNVDSNQAMQMYNMMYSCNKITALNTYVQSFRNKVKDSDLTKEEKTAWERRYQNLLTDDAMRNVASFYPEWFSNIDDAVTIGKRCQFYFDYEHNATEEEKILRKYVNWNRDMLKASKKFLEFLNVKSFDELVGTDRIKKEDGITNYEAGNGFRLADTIFSDLTRRNRIVIDGHRYKFDEGKLVEIKGLTAGENPKKYADRLMKIHSDIRIIAGAPEVTKPKVDVDVWRSEKDAEIKKIQKINLVTLETNIQDYVSATYYRYYDWMREENEFKKHKDPWTNNDIHRIASSYMDAALIHRYSKVKKGILTSKHLRILDCVNQYKDLLDYIKLEEETKKPVSENEMMANSIASRLLAARAAKHILDPNCSEEDYKKALGNITNRKVREEKLETLKKVFDIEMLVNNGIGEKLMKKSDEELMEVFHDSDSLRKLIRSEKKVLSDGENIVKPELGRGRSNSV